MNEDVYEIRGMKKLALGTQYLLRDRENGHYFLSVLNKRYLTMMLILPKDIPYWQRQLKVKYDMKGRQA